jgi:putative endopeptidase
MRLSCLAFLAALSASSLSAGIDPKNFDLSVQPQADFFFYANGGWLKANPIPPEFSSWDAFTELSERNKVNLRELAEAAAAAPQPDASQKLAGNFYASGMDTAAIEAAGLQPLQPELDRIAALQSHADIEAEIVRLQTIGVHVGFFFGSEPDPVNSKMVIAALSQGGLGLPERDYYTRSDDKSKLLREQYLAHVAKILVLGGEAPAAAATEATAIMQLETALALGSKNRNDLRDPVANYHRMTEAGLQKLTPVFDWRAYFAALPLAQVGDIDVGQPEFFQKFDEVFATTPVAGWQAYLRWQLLHARSGFLASGFVDESFAFFGKTLTGQEKLRERWKRVLDATNSSVGEALGQLYVAKYFPPESKTAMLQLVGNLEAALRERLQHLEWMDDPTRAEALRKLAAFTVKIGYPDKWIDTSKLTIDRGPYVLNVQRAAEFQFRRDLAKIGQPLDRTEWQMTPPTVNAYYDPQLNEIVFPAGILQPPFFDPKADDAVNYGGIGAVIGHEMTHGFDDQGRHYDADGNLKNWWSDTSQAKFLERATGISEQFNGYVAVEGLRVNGNVTRGENIADLGGVRLAYTALQKALAAKPASEKIDGFTPYQRFFLSYATIWHANVRPEMMRLRVQTDPHSPPRFRVDGPLSNLPEFFAAFDIPEGSPMRRADADRVVIW